MQKPKKTTVMRSSIGLFLIYIIALLGFIGCESAHSPLYEYQVVGYVPVEAVTSGTLFITDNELVALYDTTYNRQWVIMGRYDLYDPAKPVLTDIVSLEEPIDYMYYVSAHADSFVFLYRYDEPLQILNLHTLEMISVEVQYYIGALGCKGYYLFMSTDSGLVVWDVADLQNIVEVYSEHQPHDAWDAHMALKDTLLFECYNGYDHEFKFWDISDPHNPQVIASGDFFYHLSDIRITETYVIGNYYNELYRFAYDFSDSLTLQETEYLYYGIDELELSDSLIYISNAYSIYILKIDDFGEQWMICSKNRYYDNFLAMVISRSKAYALVYKDGIYVYERTEP